MRISGRREDFFLFIKRSLGLKRKTLKNTALKSADLGSISLFASDSVCALCQIPGFSIGLSSSENPVLDWMSLTLTCKIFFT